MRVNTDGVLLGAWSPVGAVGAELPGSDVIPASDSRSEVLDIGTGTGVIALILAQRLSVASARLRYSNCGRNAVSRISSESSADRFHITAIDIDRESCLQAEENFKASQWHGILECRHVALQEYARICRVGNSGTGGIGKFDLIVTNPPYFANSLRASGERRSGARHNDALPYIELASDVVTILKDSGSFCLILPYTEFGVFEKIANGCFLFVRTRCDVYARERDSVPKRVMAEFVKGLPASSASETLVIQDNNGLTPEYKAITGDFYL